MSEEKNLKRDIAVRYIQENYQVLGENENKDYITSADIVRELSEMVSISIAEISELMDSASFKVEFIEGKPHWVVFRK